VGVKFIFSSHALYFFFIFPRYFGGVISIQAQERLGMRGRKFFKPLLRFLNDLHSRHEHPNRSLHFDQYLILLLLAYFNPAIRSLRGMIDVSGSELGERNFGLHRTSLGSLSEASHVFDPEPLRRIFLELAADAHAVDAPKLRNFPQGLELLAVDASLWKLLPRMARTFYQGKLTRAGKGALKAHVVFSVLDAAPKDVAFTDGTVDERRVLPKLIHPGAMHVFDRGYWSQALFKLLLDAGASFVTRVRSNVELTTLKERPVSEAAAKAGVCSDRLVKLNDGALNGRALRVVTVRRIVPASRNLHAKCKRGKHAAYDGEAREQEWVLITDRLDLDAELIVAIYASRWQIEVFFRWFKVVLQCKHLFSESENGMELQFYTALIASVLVVIHTQRKPTKMLLLALQMYLSGWHDWAHVEEKIAQCKKVGP